MSYLPIEIILACILPKLPAKSRIRFKCVSKSFLAEISSPKFIKQHHLNAISSNSNRLLVLPKARQGVYVYNLDSPHWLPSFCPYPKVTFYASNMSVVATCEGYLLLGYGKHYIKPNHLILLSPSIRTYREIPYEEIPHRSENVLYGMWHRLDEFNDEYKIARFLEFKRDGVYQLQVMVYNTTTNTWKQNELKLPVNDVLTLSGNTPVLVQNYLLHLILFDSERKNRIKRIGCFDMKAERWANDVDTPDVLWDKIGTNYVVIGTFYNLSELDNQLCLSGNNVIESSFDLWVMKEYGVKESWVKLISHRVSSLRIWEVNERPLAYRTRSRHNKLLYMQRRCNGQLYRYNLRDEKITEAEFRKPPKNSLAYICKGSLLDLFDSQPIRVSLEEKDDDEDFVNLLCDSPLSSKQGKCLYITPWE